MAKKKGMSSVTWVLMLLLVMSLGGFGITQFGGSVQTIATVGETEITTSDYARAVQAQMNAFQEQTRQPVNFGQAQALGLDRIALGQLITDAAIEDETRRIGLSAGDDNVAAEIRQVPAFKGITGEFDRESYELTLRQNDLSTGEFEDQIRSDLAEALVRRAIGAGVATPDVFVDTLFNHARETRDVTWARLTPADLSEPIAEPDEAALAAYHEAHADQFTRPETKVIRYAWLTPDMLVPDVEVDEAQLQKLYQTRIDEFISPERRLVERLVFADDAAAEAAKARLDAGEVTFDDLVAERGLSLEDADLGDVAESDLGAAAEGVFALTEPGTVGPLPSDLGPALFRMNGILAAEEVTFEEARDDLREEAASDRARRVIQDLIPQLEDMLASGAGPALLAERTDMEEGSIEWNADMFDDIAAYAEFRSAAAEAKPGDFGKVIELDDGGIVSLAVEEVREPALIPLAELRDDVAAAWTRDEAQAALEAMAGRLADQLRSGREMAAMDLELNVNRALRRDGFVEGTPPDFTDTVFGLEKDGIAVLAADGDAWLVRLDAITPADDTDRDAQLLKTAFSGEITQSLSTAITNAFTQALVDKVGADINSSAIRAVNTQLP